MSERLPDVLAHNMKVVFCGTAAGNKSAAIGAYYANGGNKFWKILYGIGLTPIQFEPKNFRDLANYGIGLTDLIKDAQGMDHALVDIFKDKQRIAILIEKFEEKIKRYAPRYVAFTSLKAGEIYLKNKYKGKKIAFGEQAETIGTSKIFVLPSTSSVNPKRLKQEHIMYWEQLTEAIP